MRVIVKLENDEREALIILAQREKRDPRQQAALLIRCELERRGLLPVNALAPEQKTQEHMREQREHAIA